ncbi:MAG: DUF4369 domain-containing protein [Lutibacter sp.]|uniref:DUF4369 domain-containing protein n=1 Tax=Lutibacter sp. TaxID=1925666 RepID=UPI00299D3DF1|nr:DUF4369 domain-containing protein [Lutibacter sp.]MDX1829932.1 DUF4369 domain-containing protein [Lutibacter sp.]
MKKLIGSLLIISILISCNGKKNGNMVVHGTIDGLKKGTVYLEKLKDTTLVSVDSVSLNGTNTFTLTDNVESPEVYNLTLSEKPDETISFFGEKGEIIINTKLSKFAVGAKIKGSKNQELLDEHKAMLKKFNDKQLDLIKEKFDAQKNNDSELLAKIEKEENDLVKRKYLYTTNFAIQHGKFEVAPYIALTDLYYANVKLLDTVNKSLSKKVKKSKYGLELKKFIKNIKKNEK